MYSTFNFPIKSVCNSKIISKDLLQGGHVKVEDTLREIIIRMSYDFAVGDQINVEHTSKTYTKHTVLIPQTGLDWIKQLIIEFCTQLNFGWLKPNYRKINCKVKEVCTNTYYNVYPVPQDSKEKSKYLNAYQWLTAEPFTKADLNNACKIIYTHPESRFYTAKQIAQIAVEELLHNKANNERFN